MVPLAGELVHDELYDPTADVLTMKLLLGLSARKKKKRSKPISYRSTSA